MFIYFDRQFFERLIKNLNKINYCIVGDYKNLPNSIEHDLDIWTDNQEGFLTVLKKTVKDSGFKFLLLNKTSNGFNSVLFKRENESIIVLKLDILIDCSYKSFLTLVGSNEFRKHRKHYKNIYVADEEIEALVHLLYPLLEWGEIKEKYKFEIKQNFKSELFKNTLSKLFGKGQALLLLSHIEKENWKKIEALQSKLRRLALVRFIFNYELTQFKKGILLLYHNLRRLMIPSGYYITFCGLDGAGKTTLINILNDLFVKVLKNKKVYLGYWRPYVLPEIRELFGKKNSKESLTKDTQSNVSSRQPKGVIISLFKLIYYWLDYVMGKFKFLDIRNKGGFVLFDRHYLDMIVHPNRFEMNLPKFLLRFVYRLTPKSDLSFFFWASPEIIHSRKVEFSKNEIISQTQAYIKEGRRIHNFIPIETNKPIVDEIDEILNDISKKRRHV